jgi:hypothetical protein
MVYPTIIHSGTRLQILHINLSSQPSEQRLGADYCAYTVTRSFATRKNQTVFQCGALARSPPRPSKSNSFDELRAGYFLDRPYESKDKSEGVESLDHHLLLSLITHEHASALENSFQGLNHFLEAACCSLFLCETSNTEVRSLSVLDDSHDFARECDPFHL